MFDQKRRRTAEFTAGRKALHQAGRQNRDRREDADGFVGRHESDHERAEGHHHDGNHQRGLAAVPVGVGAENDAADRSNKVRQTERAERQQDRNRRIAVREKCLREIRGKLAVDSDVIPFQRVADRCRDDELCDILSF